VCVCSTETGPKRETRFILLLKVEDGSLGIDLNIVLTLPCSGIDTSGIRDKRSFYRGTINRDLDELQNP
jgi:hypothetical protein